MEVHLIPVEDKFIIYRPLLRLAFIGNRAMADLTQQYAKQPDYIIDTGEVTAFLDSIGFTQPDPQPPPDPGRAFLPTSAALLMTGRCNLRCIYCYAHGGEIANQDLPLEAATAVIDRVCENAIKLDRPYFEVTFHGGGEPTLAWETIKAATLYARKKELPAYISMVSNGVWNKVQCKWVVANLDGLTLSIDGDQPTQDAQRPFLNGKGSFNAVMHTVNYLDSVQFPYGVRVTATTERFADLPADIAFLCQETGCKSVHIEPTFNTMRGSHHTPSTAQALDFAEFFLSAYDIAQEFGRELNYSGARPWLLSSSFCTAPLGSALTVNPEGDIVACYEITDRSHPLANRSTFGSWKTDGVLQVDDAQRNAFLDYISARRAVCRDCFCYWHCAGDCYTRAFKVKNNIGLPYARCTVNRAITIGLLLRYIATGEGKIAYRVPMMQPGISCDIKVFTKAR